MTPPVVQDVVERYHAALEIGDYDLLMTTVSDDVVLRSPITSRVPITGTAQVRSLLGIVLGAFDDLQSEAHPMGADLGVVHFSASVRGTPLEGVDLLRVGPDGRIAEITIYIRPLTGLLALMSAIGGDVARSNGRPMVARLSAFVWLLFAAARAGDRFVVPLALSRKR